MENLGRRLFSSPVPTCKIPFISGSYLVRGVSSEPGNSVHLTRKQFVKVTNDNNKPNVSIQLPPVFMVHNLLQEEVLQIFWPPLHVIQLLFFLWLSWSPSGIWKNVIQNCYVLFFYMVYILQDILQNFESQKGLRCSEFSNLRHFVTRQFDTRRLGRVIICHATINHETFCHYDNLSIRHFSTTTICHATICHYDNFPHDNL